MKRKIRNVSLAQQLSLMTCLCLLIPMVLLSVSMIRSVRTTTLTTRQREAQSRCSSVISEAEQVAELCNMSTQVILNTPDLKTHLLKPTQNVQPDTLTLLEFYRQNISSLEKIVLSNPNLYQIRVYSAAENIQEMTPILYSGRRMSRMPWGDESAISEGKWYLDYRGHAAGRLPRRRAHHEPCQPHHGRGRHGRRGGGVRPHGRGAAGTVF